MLYFLRAILIVSSFFASPAGGESHKTGVLDQGEKSEQAKKSDTRKGISNEERSWAESGLGEISIHHLDKQESDKAPPSKFKLTCTFVVPSASGWETISTESSLLSLLVGWQSQVCFTFAAKVWVETKQNVTMYMSLFIWGLHVLAGIYSGSGCQHARLCAERANPL